MIKPRHGTLQKEFTIIIIVSVVKKLSARISNDEAKDAFESIITDNQFDVDKRIIRMKTIVV